MLENLGLSAAILATVAGALLLFTVASSSDTSLFASAALLAAGLIADALILKSKLHGRRIQRQYRERG